jgi:predicted nucleic acid-binding protein
MRARPSSPLPCSVPARGHTFQLIELARAGQIELAVSDAIPNETSPVLRDKFKVPADDVQAFRDEVVGFAKRVTPHRNGCLPGDLDDDRIVECAVVTRADTIVTGDKHLLTLGSFRGIRLQRIADFLAACRSREL